LGSAELFCLTQKTLKIKNKSNPQEKFGNLDDS